MSAALVHVDQLDCSFEPQPWPFATQQADAIDAHWTQARAQKPGLFNGQVLVAHDVGIENQPVGGAVFRARFMAVDYKAFLAWRDFAAPGTPVYNCFAMAALQTRDGVFVLGEMAAHTANAGLIHFAAGTPDLSDVINGKVDLAGSVLRELQEETGLCAQDIEMAPGWTLVLDGPRIACMKHCVLKGDAEAVMASIAAFLATQAEPELVRTLVWRRAGDIDAALLPGFMQAYLASF